VANIATVINDGDKFATSVNSRMPHNSMNAKKKKHKTLHGREHHKNTNISGMGKGTLKIYLKCRL
jgi:hypothetical protein